MFQGYISYPTSDIGICGGLPEFYSMAVRLRESEKDANYLEKVIRYSTLRTKNNRIRSRILRRR